jgi:hypothetical protein
VLALVFGRFVLVSSFLEQSAATRPTPACTVRVIEDILSSERDNGGGDRGYKRASCGKRSTREQGREMVSKKVQVSAKISRNRIP